MKFTINDGDFVGPYRVTVTGLHYHIGPYPIISATPGLLADGDEVTGIGPVTATHIGPYPLIVIGSKSWFGPYAWVQNTPQ